MNKFQEMGLPEALLSRLENLKFTEPTPIQQQAIPVALTGRDILGSAQTGTGKTGAFGMPLVAKILSNSTSTALVMAPTRELARQVMNEIESFLGRNSPINTALLIGGEPIFKQLSQLKRRPRIFVGTPGRINDHLIRKSLNLKNTDFLVLDETDRMLDMGFTEQIEEVIEHLASDRQTLLFSATIPHNIEKIASKYLNNPERIAVKSKTLSAENVKQETIKVAEADKYSSLVSQLNDRQGSIIVFVKTKFATERMAIKLLKDGHEAKAIHGDLRQNKRDKVISSFRKKKYRILVATDVAARGLDIPHIEHVINYDLPQCKEDYVHRIGRTARAGAEGAALNLVAPIDNNKWDIIFRYLNPDAPRTNTKKRDSNSRDSKRRPRNNRKTDGRDRKTDGRDRKADGRGFFKKKTKKIGKRKVA